MTAVSPVLTAAESPVLTLPDTTATTPDAKSARVSGGTDWGNCGLARSRPSRAVSRNRNCGRPGVFGVRPNRFDHEVEFVGAIDLARYAVGHAGPDELGFREVMKPVNALRVEIPQQEHRTRWIFRP